MKLKITSTLILLSLLLPLLLSGQEDWNNFHALNSGIAGNNIISIAIDPDGNHIWFGSGEDTLFINQPGSRGVSCFHKYNQTWQIYTTQHGLAHNTVYSITCNTRQVWFATRNALCCLDKLNQSWTVYDSLSGGPKTEQIRQIQIESDTLWILDRQQKIWSYNLLTHIANPMPLTSDAVAVEFSLDKDIIWIASEQGLIRLDRSNGQQRMIIKADGLIDNTIHCVSSDENDIWCGSSKGVSRISKKTLQCTNYTIFNSELAQNEITSISGDTHFIWFLTRSQGVSCFDKKNGRWQNFNLNSGGLGETSLQCMAGDIDYMWFGGKKRGVYQYLRQAKVWFSLNKDDGLAGNHILSIGVDRHDVWIATQSGLSRYYKSDGQLRNYNSTNSNLSQDVILSIGIDSQSVWFGTEGGGVCQYHKQDSLWKIYDTSNSPIIDNLIQSITLNENEIWFGSRSNGLCRYDKTNNRWTTFTSESYEIRPHQSIPSNDVRVLAMDSLFVWAGFLHSVIFGDEVVFSRYDRKLNSWKHFTHDTFGSFSAGNNVQSIGLDGIYTWLGFFEPWSGAMNRYNQNSNSMETFTYEDGLADRNVWAIGIDRVFNWFGTGSGLSRYEKSKGEWVIFNTNDGLPHNWIRCIGIDSGGVWFGTLGGGICLYSDQQAPILMYEPILSTQPVHQAITITAQIQENVKVLQSRIMYRQIGSTLWDSVEMSRQSSQFWIGEIPSFQVNMQGLEYYLKADDGYNTGYHPHQYPSTSAHPINVYDDLPPQATLLLTPLETRSMIFPGDTLIISGLLDGTESIPQISDLRYSFWGSDGQWLFNQAIPLAILHPQGQGTIRHINDTLPPILFQDQRVTAVEFNLTISESPHITPVKFSSNRKTISQDYEMPLAIITSPRDNDKVGSIVTIHGTAYDQNIKSYQLKYGLGFNPSDWISFFFNPIKHGIVDSTLGKWVTLELPDTVYSLLLEVQDQANQITRDTVQITMDKIPFHAETGGYILSQDSLFKLYIPPQALSTDQPIIIQNNPDPPPLPESIPNIEAYVIDILPLTISLSKPASLEMIKIPSEQARFHQWNDETKTWLILGGSINTRDNSLLVRITTLGTYGVWKDSISGTPSNDGLNFECQPRLFSPLTGYPAEKTTLSFYLDTSESISLKIYNLSGRLVRCLKENEIMSSGIQAVTWNGRDSQGHTCPSDLYLVTLIRKNSTQTKTVAIVNR